MKTINFFCFILVFLLNSMKPAFGQPIYPSHNNLYNKITQRPVLKRINQIYQKPWFGSENYHTSKSQNSFIGQLDSIVMGYTGEIKDLHTFEYGLNNRLERLNTTIIEPGYHLQAYSTYSYNNDGQIVGDWTYERNVLANDTFRLAIKTQNSFANLNLTEWKVLVPDGNQFVTTFLKEYFYNTNNQLVMSDSRFPTLSDTSLHSREAFSYWENKISKREIYAERNNLITLVESDTLHYNSQGLLTEFFVRRVNNGIFNPSQKYLWTYDSIGNRLSETVYEVNNQGLFEPRFRAEAYYNTSINSNEVIRPKFTEYHPYIFGFDYPVSLLSRTKYFEISETTNDWFEVLNEEYHYSFPITSIMQKRNKIKQSNTYIVQNSFLQINAGLGIHFCILSTVGKVVLEGLTQGQILDVSSLKPGLYFIRITQNGIVDTSSFIKN